MRILSGVKPTGRLHVGNYFGAIRQFIEYQNRGDAFYFIADLHALDMIRNAEELRELSFEMAIDYLSLGLDPNHCTLFVQSHVPQVSELQWVLGTVTPMGLLQRAHAYKDALARGKEVDFGLFSYPVLMASDILLYHSDLVPVGKDQKQHVEITRDIAVKFNTTYCKDFDPGSGEGGVLRLPEPEILDDSAVVPGVDGQKMSKSKNNTIELFGTDKQLKKSVMRIVTDSTPVEDPKDPDACTVYGLLALVSSGEELAGIRADYERGGVGYGDFKKRLLEGLHATFDPARERRAELQADPDYVRDVLGAGAKRAREVGAEVLEGVQVACGLR